MLARKRELYLALSLLLLVLSFARYSLGRNLIEIDARCYDQLGFLFGVTAAFGPLDFGQIEIAESWLDLEHEALMAYSEGDSEWLREVLEKWNRKDTQREVDAGVRYIQGAGKLLPPRIVRIFLRVRSRYIDPETGEWRPDILQFAGLDGSPRELPH